MPERFAGTGADALKRSDDVLFWYKRDTLSNAEN
jgi:hypothetical protein